MRARTWFVLSVVTIFLEPTELLSQARTFQGGGAGIGAMRQGGGFSGGTPAVRSFHSGTIQAPSAGSAFKGGSPSGGAAIRNFNSGSTPSVRSFHSTAPQGTFSNRGTNQYPGSARSFQQPFNSGNSSRSSLLPDSRPKQAFYLPNRANNAQQHQVNRQGADSFIRRQDINNQNWNHWTHNHGKWNHWNNNWWWNHRHNNTVIVWPWLGFGNLGLFGGWGWPYYGWGYGYGYPLYATTNLGFGYPYYNGYIAAYAAAPNNGAAVAQVNPAPALDDAAADDAFAERGEANFKAGDYQAAARDWRHALVDDPKNGGLMMLLAQALFAAGQYEEAAGATQAGMQMLPEDKWGVVIKGYQELYGNPQDYTDQIRALEKARTEKLDSPALRFLLGFQFGYLGYPKQAVIELDKGLAQAPQDMGALKVRQLFAAKWPGAPAPPAAALEAARQFEAQQKQPGLAPPAPQPPAGAPVKPPAPADAEPGTPS